jgi:DNA processing protein
MYDRPDAPDDLSALSLSFIRGFAREHLDALRRGFGSLVEARRAKKGALLAAGIPEELLAPMVQGAGLREAEVALGSCERLGVRVLLPHHAAWPQAVEAVDPRPIALYARGQLPTDGVAIVGARRCDLYGLQLARRLGRELAGEGFCVVSGGALGVDGAAHQGALDTGRASSTLAVLGCGIDVAYPPRHRELLARIARDGTLLSEFPLGTRPFQSNFPQRNRLIAALSSAVVVVRAAHRSGSLVTARWARGLELPLLACPGPVGDTLSEGTHDLLRSGAQICATAGDVLLSLGRTTVPKSPPSTAAEGADLDQRASRLLGLLSKSPARLDELGLEAGIGTAQAAAWMTRLELMGFAERRDGGFVRAN